MESLIHHNTQDGDSDLSIYFLEMWKTEEEGRIR